MVALEVVLALRNLLGNLLGNLLATVDSTYTTFYATARACLQVRALVVKSFFWFSPSQIIFTKYSSSVFARKYNTNMTILSATSIKRSKLAILLVSVSSRLSRGLARSNFANGGLARGRQSRSIWLRPRSLVRLDRNGTARGDSRNSARGEELHKPQGGFRGFDALFEETNLDVQAVSRLLLAETSELVSPIPHIVQHIVSSGGKRLRARLVIASARLLGYRGGYGDGGGALDTSGSGCSSGSGGDIVLGAVIEAIHCASLLHDDVVDGSKMRRGLPVANFLWGAQASVLVGDFLFARAFALMCGEKNLEILQLLSRTAVRLTQGEVRQLYSARALAMPEDECLDIIKDKTATLFGAATTSGALLARGSEKQRQALASFGENFGIGYQLADDMLDYVAQRSSLGKQRGDDLRDGKITYPLILGVARANKKERKRIKQLFANKACRGAQVEEVLGIMQRYDCLEDCSTLAREYLLQGAAAIEGVGDARLRVIMQQACIASINRIS